MEECLPQQWTKSALRTGFYYVTWDKDFDWDALRTQIEAKGNRCLQYNLGVLNGTIDTPFTLMQKEISKELAGKE
jgi:hypothetical protein